MANPYLDQPEENPYLDAQVIPKTENLLQRAMSSGKKFIESRGASLEPFVPQSKEEWADVPRIVGQTVFLRDYLRPPDDVESGIPELGSIEQFGQSAQQKLDEILTPKTEWGQEMSKFGQRVGLAVPGAIGLKRLGQWGINKIKSPFTTKKLTQELKAISDPEKVARKQGELKTAVNELAYTGERDAQAKIQSHLKNLYEDYEAAIPEFKQAGEYISRRELSDAVKRTSSKLGLGNRKILEGDEAKLRSLASEILPAKRKGESAANFAKRAEAKLDANDVKSFLRNKRSDMDPSGHEYSEMYKSVMDLIEQKMPGYKALREKSAAVYSTAKDARQMFKSGGIRSLTRPDVAPSKVKRAEQLEKEIGLDVTGKANEIRAERDWERMRGPRVNKLKQEIALRNQRKAAVGTAAKWTGGLGAGIGVGLGMMDVLKKALNK